MEAFFTTCGLGLLACDRLVAEVEARYPDASTGAVEIRLDFSEVILSQDYVEPQPTGITSEPEVNVNLQRRTARVNFPSDFLVHFQQHENTGERLVLRGIARGLVSLHQCVTDGIDEVVLDNLIGTVIDRGARILHLFRTHYPIKQLLVQQQQKPVFLSHPDLVFSRLRLSEGCTEARLGTSIASKHECNEFLHRVVKRVWNELRGLLHSFDRASVILQVLIGMKLLSRPRSLARMRRQSLLSMLPKRMFLLSHRSVNRIEL